MDLIKATNCKTDKRTENNLLAKWAQSVLPAIQYIEITETHLTWLKELFSQALNPSK